MSACLRDMFASVRGFAFSFFLAFSSLFPHFFFPCLSSRLTASLRHVHYKIYTCDLPHSNDTHHTHTQLVAGRPSHPRALRRLFRVAPSHRGLARPPPPRRRRRPAPVDSCGRLGPPRPRVGLCRQCVSGQASTDSVAACHAREQASRGRGGAGAFSQRGRPCVCPVARQCQQGESLSASGCDSIATRRFRAAVE